MSCCTNEPGDKTGIADLVLNLMFYWAYCWTQTNAFLITGINLNKVLLQTEGKVGSKWCCGDPELDWRMNREPVW